MKALTSVAILVLVPVVFVSQLRGGGVLYVAGVSGFDPNAEGKPITWANGAIVYFTDQGDAGPMLPQSAANAFVADALSRWTSVPTAALMATRGGALAEDVNGTNVTSVDGLVMPLDIQPSATNKPLAIVYDNDGQVIDALLGAGASDPISCATNSVLGGPDRFSTDAHIIHALIVINGRCAQNASDLAPLKYHLIRVLGRTLGLDWSQANNNVRTGMPFPSSEDVAGFPLMHPLEPFCASVITTCIANADQLRMDDRAAVSRLYPVTAQNISAFSGKQLLSANTIRIHGSVYFPDAHGNPGQPMQGVNVVVRWIDPNTGLPSGRYVASSVSGFLFRGNAGNRVSGFGNSQRFDAFGSSQRSVEGFFDLAGIELPNGQLTATYQITVESIDPLYSGEFTVGPYASGVVTPSGTTPAILVSGLSAGSDVTRDIVMGGSRIAPARVDATEPNSFFTPSPVPPSGQWWGSLNGYADEDFFTFAGHANRTFSLQVTSLNEALLPTSGKAQPELGLWRSSDPSTALATADAFNGPSLGVTELTAGLDATQSFKFGIVDYRGDGRPDFLYHARFLYADTVSPVRINAGGVPIAIRGIGFRRGMSVTVGGVPAAIIAQDENQIFVTAPALNSGVQDITITDPETGATTVMIGAITYGLVAGDHVIVISSANPLVGVGTDTPNPIVVRAVAADGVTPLQGVSITFSVAPSNSKITACGSSTCVLTSDANGEASVLLTVKSVSNTVSATLANGEHADATITGTTAMTISPLNPVTAILAGGSASVTISVKVFSGGAPVVGKLVNFIVTSGNGTLTAASATTIPLFGIADSTLKVINLSGTVNVSACVVSGPCTNVTLQAVSPANVRLQKSGGDHQLLIAGQNANPFLLRVTDSSNPPVPIFGVGVTITGNVYAPPAIPDCNPSDGVCRPAANISVARISGFVGSDPNGYLSFTPTLQSTWGAVRVVAIASAEGFASQNFDIQVIAPQP